MVKGCSFLIIGFLLLISLPICIAVGGGIFGLIFGLIGGAIGLVFGLIGAIIGGIAAILKGILHLFFGWGWESHDFHPWHFHFNGYLVLALIVLIFVIASRNKK